MNYIVTFTFLQIGVDTYAMASNYLLSAYWLLLLTLTLPFHYCWPALELTDGDPASSNNNTVDRNKSDTYILSNNNTEKDASALVAQVKSLNTFANHIDDVKSTTIQTPNLNEEFKPSIRLSDSEDNLVQLMPVQASQFSTIPISKSISPVLVQYLPQTVYQNGIRYLHLIPTKPLMIPFSSFINTPTFSPQLSNDAPQLLLAPNNVHVGNFPLSTTSINTIPSAYKLPTAPAMLRSSMLFNQVSGNTGSSASLENRAPSNLPSATLITISAAPSQIPGNNYNLESIPTQYNYRSSRDLKEQFSSPISSLNLNEYLPETYKTLSMRTKRRP